MTSFEASEATKAGTASDSTGKQESGRGHIDGTTSAIFTAGRIILVAAFQRRLDPGANVCTMKCFAKTVRLLISGTHDFMSRRNLDANETIPKKARRHHATQETPKDVNLVDLNYTAGREIIFKCCSIDKPPSPITLSTADKTGERSTKAAAVTALGVVVEDKIASSFARTCTSS
mmetsp:Transcript_22855/g.34303  ORF Transcript_22855/g.34303 Transcript_22855/m.34303 type:complete len:175 (-) Transcript_22855:602-1126(-)